MRAMLKVLATLTLIFFAVRWGAAALAFTLGVLLGYLLWGAR